MSVDLSKYAWDGRKVPFIRVFPDGKKVLSEVMRSKEITVMAHHFIAMGGRFMISKVMDRDRDVEVELIAATYDNMKQPIELAREVSDDGPELMRAVDRLVRAAHAKILVN